MLSGYLDGTLSADERARVEQLLQSDTEFSDELAQLRNLGRSLKAISDADSDIKLDAGFADRVLGAAVARACAEGYGDDHPLVRLSGHPSTPARTARGASSWRYAGVLVGLAASIAIAVVALRPEVTQDPGLALLPETQSTAQENPLSVPDPLTESATKLVDSDAKRPVAPTEDESEVEPDSTQSTMKQLESPPQPTEAIARSETRPMKEFVEPPATTKMEVPNTSSGAILVLDVRRTASGRQSGAVADAMEHASLGPASEKEITEEIVGLVKETQQSADEEVSVLYLQAPARSLDRFYLRLMADREGIESVGMTIALDAPVMKMVRALRSDPTAVRHNASLQLISENGVVGQFASQLGQLQYIPLNQAALNTIPSKGPDVPAQILVLVR